MTEEYGYEDLPLEPSSPNGSKVRDELGIDAYYRGLAKFIENCKTPMTIAVQGDWGSGKSTALNFVAEFLSKDVEVLRFDTWMYSQFDLGESLVFSMANEIVSPIAKNSEAGKRVIETFKRLSIPVLMGGIRAAGNIFGLGAIAEEAAKAVRNPNDSAATIDVIERLKSVRKDFGSAVDAYCEKMKKKRMVVFIDDLDRVDPARAIDILECLKLFLEVPNCVFVLALDFDVVLRGVEKKYEAGFDLRKSRQYFDKIIQVPFMMPTAAYKVDGLVLGALRKAGLVAAEEGDRAKAAEKYMEAVRFSVGTNPRSIKRLLNSFDLLRLIEEARGVSLEVGSSRALAIFALLCAQVTYPEYHRRIIEAQNNEEEMEQLLTDSEIDVEGWTQEFDLGVREVATFALFRSVICSIFQSGEKIDRELVSESIKLSEITVVGPGPVKGSGGVRMLADIDELRKLLEGDAPPHIVLLMEKLMTGLRERLDPREFSMGKQQGAMFSLYARGEMAGVGQRSRQRFAGMSYSSKSVKFTFGRLDSDPKDPDRPVTPEWRELGDRLEQQFAGGGSPRFRYTKSGYPMQIEGVNDGSQVSSVCDALVQIYELEQKE